MPGPSTTKYNGYETGAPNVVSPHITLGILVAGVVGGLVIVIAVILFCKYCVTKSRGNLRRDQSTDCERSTERRFKPFQRYETINSDMFSDPSTGSMDAMPISPRKLFDANQEKLFGADEISETTKLKADFDKTSYRDVDCEDPHAYVPESEFGGVVEQAVGGAGTDVIWSERNEEHKKETEGAVEESNGRRVSFQDGNVPQNPTSYLRKGRRYTEGDFHYLKRIRIDKRSPRVPRQYSMGPMMSPAGSPRHPEMIEMVPLHSLGNAASGIEEQDALTMSLDSPSPTNGPIRTQVAVDVEVHYGDRTSKDRTAASVAGAGDSVYFVKNSPSPRKRVEGKTLKPQSLSLDIVSPTDLSARTKRRVKSYDDVAEYDYDVLKITEFSKGPFYNNGFEAIAEMESPCSSKVRYNDMGSLEVLNEENLDYYDELEFENNIIPDESDETETLNGTQKYRELWNLRTTLEEEEECSDTIRMEDMTSPDEQSPEREQVLAYKPFYDAVVEVVPYPGNTPHHNAPKQHSPHLLDPDVLQASSTNFLHPNYENRRESYKKILTRRFQKHGSTSAENSFDSVETADTDGDVSDTSRQEMTTTSFESTTDNTDSTNDSQTNRLRQMKADSGYKSLETQHPPGQGSNGVKKSVEDEITVLESTPYQHEAAAPSTETASATIITETVPPPIRRSKFEKRNGRTASKRRREYSRERQGVRLYDSIYEPETDSRSDQPSGDSFEEPNAPSKFSVFTRFFKSQRHNRGRSLSRDFSIDEKSNDIFQEFVRYDPKLDGHRDSTVGLKMTPSGKGHRLQRKYTDPGPGVFEERTRRDRLVPEMRSTSLGSDSSASSVRRISPHDSIEEEEDYEEDIDAAFMRHKKSIEDSRVVEVTTPSLSIHEIPIIKLPEGEIAES